MRYLLSTPSRIEATIQLPASKGISSRTLIIYAPSKGSDVLSNLSGCDDTKVMVKALTGGGEVIDILTAGTAMRSLTAYLSSTPGTHIIIGTERMQRRPVRILVNALREPGAGIEYTCGEGFPPLRIEGTPLVGNEITLRGDVSSRYISVLLMIRPILKNGLQLRLTGKVVSRPYINLTLQLMEDFSASARWTSDQSISIEPQPYRYVPFVVESDWSAASYWYQMAVLSSETDAELIGLFRHSYQGDSRGAEVFTRLGIEAEYTEEGMQLREDGSCVERLDEDFVDIPDLAQIFVVTCALLDVPSRFTGLQNLKIKETDCIEALKAKIKKLRYVLHDEDDSILYWNGERIEPQAYPVIETYEDHRMAMAFTPAATRYPTIQTDEPQVVSKPYPGCWDDLRKAGFVIKVHAAETSSRR